MGRTAKTKRLTAIAVKRYAEGPNTTKELHDGGGLYLRKRSEGVYWYLRLTDPVTGANQWHKMFSGDPEGDYPHKTLSDARAEAGRMWEIRRHGIDPRAEQKRSIEQHELAAVAIREADAKRLTVRQVFERWVEMELKPHIRPDGSRTGRKDGGKYVSELFERRLFAALGATTIGNVRKADLIAILDRARAEGRLRTANVLLASMKQMLRFAQVRELIERSPLETVTKRDAGGVDVDRNRALSVEEISQLARQCASLSNRSRGAIWIILATGCRVGELMKARWENIDLDSNSWYLPETKNGRDHTVHLSKFATEHFSRLHTLREQAHDGSVSPWVFPNNAGTGTVDIKSFGKQLADRQRPSEKRMNGRSVETSGLSLPGGRWTAHDLRRTAATLMASLGISGDVIDECLNHEIESRVRRIYIRDRRPAGQAHAFDALGVKLTALVSQ